MSQATAYLAVFLALFLVALGGVFLFGWFRRKVPPPKVPPLPREDD